LLCYNIALTRSGRYQGDFHCTHRYTGHVLLFFVISNTIDEENA
jgi:hypothetical protein